MTQRTVVVVDDSRDFRDSLQWWLAGTGHEVRVFGKGERALDSLLSDPPCGLACMLLDVRMPGMSGFALHDAMVEHGLRLPVIYMTGFGDVPLAVQAMRKGAVTMLEKPFADGALEHALQLAFEPAPQPAFAPADPAGSGAAEPAGEAPHSRPDGAAREWADRVARLSPREREVLGWLMQDKLNKTMSDLMAISVKTVELHRANLMKKLGAKSVSHLVRMAVSERVT